MENLIGILYSSNHLAMSRFCQFQNSRSGGQQSLRWIELRNIENDLVKNVTKIPKIRCFINLYKCAHEMNKSVIIFLILYSSR